MQAGLSTKSFILMCFLFLSIPLFISLQSLSDNGRESILDLSINSTSNWTQLRIEGADLIDVSTSNPYLKMDYGSDSLTIREPIKSTIRAKIRSVQDSVTFYLSKAPLGVASADIKGIGVLEDFDQPLSVPISIKTNSSLCRVSLNGMRIESARIDKLKGITAYPAITANSISINNPFRENSDANLTMNLSYQEDYPTILLEKGDDGRLAVRFFSYLYHDNRTGNRTQRDVPVTIEMTSNRSQVFLEGGEIARGKVLQLDNQDLQESIVGENFIYLKYSHDGNAFRRASYLLDLNLSKDSKLIIYKNNSGFVNVRVGEDSYFSTDFDKNLTYTSDKFDLKDLSHANQKGHVFVPVTIETTSDWTDVSIRGLENAEATVTKIAGDVAPPTISGGTISIRKNNLMDTSLAKVELSLRADEQQDGSIVLDKGDLGYTRVNVGDRATFSNDGKINGDPSNSRTYDLPKLPEENNTQEIYNPVAYIIPIYAILFEKGLPPEGNGPKTLQLTVNQDDLPGWSIILNEPVAKGLMVYVFLSYLILAIFGLLMLNKEGYFESLQPYFKSIQSEKISRSTIRASPGFIWAFAMEKFELAPISSVIIFEALVALAITPFLLLQSETLANGTAILAYLLLVAGVATRFLEMKNILRMNIQERGLLKIESLGILLAAGYIGTFEIQNIGSAYEPIAAIGMFIATCVFLWIVYSYLKTASFK